ncbi:MAG: potassium channel protein [Acidobacteriota bacterium]
MVRDNQVFFEIHRKILAAVLSLIIVLAVGTTGYWLIGGPQYSWLDCLYMTIITISTIGFTEIIDLSNNPQGRLFTIVLALSGIGVLTYLISTITASVVDGELNEVFRSKKMDKSIQKYHQHFIVCGTDAVAEHILAELYATKRPVVVVSMNPDELAALLDLYPDQTFVEGDATDNGIQLRAGIERAEGLFAVTEDDNQNLVISLTAKQLNPKIKVVSRCSHAKNIQKMEKVGADSVVSTASIGGLRMASVMVRPAVVSFLDVMLRDNKNLRIEEAVVGSSLLGKPLSSLHLENYPSTLILAIKNNDGYVYNPPRNHVFKGGEMLVIMTTPQERIKFESYLQSA